MTFAVAGGGRVTGTFIARLPRLASELGPVAAPEVLDFPGRSRPAKLRVLARDIGFVDLEIAS